MPVDQDPIENGMVQTVGDRILAVGKFSPADSHDPVIDLGDGAIIPGLVNVHTHLEFSDIRHPLGYQGISFTDWIGLVVSLRRESEGQGTKANAIRIGLKESFESGVWVVGDIATIGARESKVLPVYESQHPNHLVLPFLEQLGRNEKDFDAKLGQLKKHLEADNHHASPHAPYSTHPDLVNQITRQATSANRMVAMHLAETKAELQLLNERSGEFVDMLQSFGVWDKASFDEKNTIPELLRTLAGAPRSLIIHGNYLSESEVTFIAGKRETMSIVFCPRTHQYFGHDEYPLKSFRRNQIRVALGTDSRASNPDLNLFEEMLTVAESFPQISTNDILKMGTIIGAESLGVQADFGSLLAGKKAALSFVSNPNQLPTDSPESWLLSPGASCRPIC